MSQDNLDRPSPPSDEDFALARELTAVREQRQRLYDKLNGSLKALISHCEWRITSHKNGLVELVVVCPNMAIYKRLHKRSEAIHNRFQDTVEVKHTRFLLFCPKYPRAYYEHEVRWGD